IEAPRSWCDRPYRGGGGAGATASRTLRRHSRGIKKFRWKPFHHLFSRWPPSGGRCSMTLIIAHRGASRAAPENTVAAFRRAVEMGADAIELDVRRTGDDRLVVHHDPSIADGRAIRELSAGELPGWVPEMSDALDA